MHLKTDKEFQSLIPPLEKEELKQLKDNLKKEGWRKHEKIILWKGVIVDGHNRYNLCKDLGIKFKVINKKFKDKKEIMTWIINNQLGRRNLVPYDRIRLALKKEEFLKPIAKERQRESGGAVPQKSAKPPIDVREEVAKIAHVSHDTISKVKFIEKEADQKTKEKLSKGQESINKIYTILKRKEKVKHIKKELKKPKLRDKKYEIIYADPAWNYDRNVGEGIAREQYSLSSLEEMKRIPIKHITEDNAVLFMWVTWPMLEQGLELMNSWGFKYKTCAFNWIKLNKDGKPFFGIGYYTKSNSEVCLLGIKGKGLTVLDNTISQIIMTQKNIHSKKPSEVRKLIVQLFGDRKRIELFARDKVEGWDAYGDEIK